MNRAFQFDHEAKKLAFVMQVHELDYVFDSPHLRNAFDPHSLTHTVIEVVSSKPNKK